MNNRLIHFFIFLLLSAESISQEFFSPNQSVSVELENIKWNIIEDKSGGSLRIISNDSAKEDTCKHGEIKEVPNAEILVQKTSDLNIPPGTSSENLYGGFHFGLNFARQRGIGFDPEDPAVTGFLVALPLEMKLSLRFSIQLEACFVQKGKLFYDVRYSNWGYWYSTKHSTVYSFLEIPFSFKGYLPISKRFKLYGMSGISFGYLVSGRSVEGDVKKKIDFSDTTATKTINRLDFGFQLGGGVETPFLSGVLFGELRYFHGLSNMYKAPSESSVNKKISNQAVGLTVGYKIPLGKGGFSISKSSK